MLGVFSEWTKIRNIAGREGATLLSLPHNFAGRICDLKANAGTVASNLLLFIDYAQGRIEWPTEYSVLI